MRRNPRVSFCWFVSALIRQVCDGVSPDVADTQLADALLAVYLGGLITMAILIAMVARFMWMVLKTDRCRRMQCFAICFALLILLAFAFDSL
jgi:putative copper export protein